jgi:aromatic-L-amino-acid decarboxylase
MVCFHGKDATEAELGERNAAILREILRRGRVYVSNASVHGAFALRACIVTHRTIDADIVAAVEEVVAAAAATA